MNTRDATSGLGMGVAGLFLQAAGSHVQRSYEGVLLLGALLYLVGTGLLIAGLACFAKAKGRSPVWGVLAFLSFLGLVVLVVLKDSTSDDEQSTSPRDEGEKIVGRAAELDFKGQWAEAVALFEEVIEKPEFQEHHLYARNCIDRIREKQGLAKWDF